MNSKKFKLEVPPFGCTIWVLFGYKESFVDTVKTLKLKPDVMEQIVQYTVKDYIGAVYVNNQNLPVVLHLLNYNHLTIVHEVHHIVEYCGRYFGFSRCLETKAYLQEYLIKKIKQKMK